MKRVKTFEDFSEGNHLDEDRLMGRELKAQKFIDMCIAVAEKAISNPEQARRVVADHTLSYDLLKKITDAINKI